MEAVTMVSWLILLYWVLAQALLQLLLQAKLYDINILNIYER